MHEQKVAGERKRLVGDEGEAAERVAGNVHRAERCPSESDRVAIGQRLIGEAPFDPIIG